MPLRAQYHLIETPPYTVTAQYSVRVDDEVDEELLREIESFRDLSNISFFAFTATPKAKTLEMFGTRNELGEYHPFHLYTMKQAIKEGFILDVLKHYITYPTYFKLVKTIEDDPEFEEKKAKRVLRKFVEEHPHAIKMKTEIMVDHFMNSTMKKIRGRARAMVVTRSRLHAVLYKKAFDRYIKENNYPIKTLVAFTGTVKHDGQEYTETSMNDLGPGKSIENAFQEDPYRILIVALPEHHPNLTPLYVFCDSFSMGVEKKLGVCAHSFHMIRVLLCCLRGLAKR